MDYKIVYTHETEDGDEIVLDVEFSYSNRDEAFSIDKVTVKDTEEDFEDYDEDELYVKMEEHALDSAEEAKGEAMINDWEDKNRY
jgi:hypothetical protein